MRAPAASSCVAVPPNKRLQQTIHRGFKGRYPSVTAFIYSWLAAEPRRSADGVGPEPNDPRRRCGSRLMVEARERVEVQARKRCARPIDGVGCESERPTRGDGGQGEPMAPRGRGDPEPSRMRHPGSPYGGEASLAPSAPGPRPRFEAHGIMKAQPNKQDEADKVRSPVTAGGPCSLS